ncbi:MULTISPECIES: PAS domain-containing protein [unclassified Streptomyces]|uniref:PAS domain-containing protein n=1 Tax=unclassified Streptomyces TaxID=2593676 RepID=UPI00338F4285
MDTWDEFLRWATPSALLTLDGAVRSLNAPMAATLGRPAKQCVGHDFISLLPETQRAAAESLLTHGATTKTVAMRVLEFSGPGEASVISLIEARPVQDPASRERLVWVHSVDARNDPGGLLIPFRLAATGRGPRPVDVRTLEASAGLAGWRSRPGPAVSACLGVLAQGGPAGSPGRPEGPETARTFDRSPVALDQPAVPYRERGVAPYRLPNSPDTARLWRPRAGLRSDPRRHPARGAPTESAGHAGCRAAAGRRDR